MNIARLKVMTVPEYLAWGDSQSEKVRAELINGQIVAMAPEQADHNRSKGSAYSALKQAVKDARLPCEVFMDGMTVPIDPHTAYVPDVLVHCGPRIPGKQLTAPAPVIVVEVISPSSEHSDTSAKLIGYFKLPSVRHYLVIDPQTRAITHHARADDGALSARTLSSGTLQLDPPGLEVDAADLLG
jgi:Uma2 family endonuclease